jgi:predicted Ser/Thr protein kinase
MRCGACSRGIPQEDFRFCPWCGQPLGEIGDLTRLADAGETVAAVAASMGTSGSRSRFIRSAPSAAAVVRADEDAPVPAGALLANRYQIVRLLGRGGMGVVYLADDLRLGHPVALKFLPAALATDARRLEQFHNEVSLARQISHPNVCRVYDIGDIDGQLFLTMEYIEGEDLASTLQRRGRLSEEEAIELTRQLCAGLNAVHAKGILHRDLKPANILIDKAGQARLMDFGIATGGAAGDAERLSEGTPAYMSPEQLAGTDVTIRSDLYALGLVMYEMFSGRRLFSAKTLEDLVRSQQTAASDVPNALSAAVRPRLQQAILHCLESDPSRRPASAPAVAAMLQTVLLDRTWTIRRIVQVATQGTVVPLLIIGGTLLGRSGTTSRLIGIGLLAVVFVLIMVEIRFPIGATVTYKGHRIRFYNNPVSGERLYIDGVLADKGGFGFNMTLRGTIESGAGAGERITAHVLCRFHRVSCLMVAEAFS